MFASIAELVEQAQRRQVGLHEIMLTSESEQTGQSRMAIFEMMSDRFQVMKRAAEQGTAGVTSLSGLTGGDAARLDAYRRQGHYLTDPTLLRAITCAIATNEVNASMGVICATPTAGSAGVLPAALIAGQEKFGLSDAETVPFLFTAGAIGYVIANNAFISGAAGGCQAEIGSASAMAAAALTELAGGTPKQAAHAMAMALKNMLGLTCDPLAGLVEVPCIKRNAAGVTNAFLAAELALAGVESAVPWDEVIDAMHQIGLSMPASLRETAMGGLAATPTGRAWRKRLWQ